MTSGPIVVIDADQDSDAQPRPAVFFDRDDTLVVDTRYMHRPEDLAWRRGAREAIAMARHHGYRVFVVSNQSGIARGFYAPDAVRAFHAAMQNSCGNGIDGLAFCPHLPDAPLAQWRAVCRCRKPAPGLLEALMSAVPVDAAGSIMIGDRDIDVAAAEAAGVRGVLCGYGPLDQVLAAALAGQPGW